MKREIKSLYERDPQTGRILLGGAAEMERYFSPAKILWDRTGDGFSYLDKNGAEYFVLTVWFGKGYGVETKKKIVERLQENSKYDVFTERERVLDWYAPCSGKRIDLRFKVFAGGISVPAELTKYYVSGKDRYWGLGYASGEKLNEIPALNETLQDCGERLYGYRQPQ